MSFEKRLPKVYRAALVPFYVDTTNSDNNKMMFMIPSDTTYGGDSPQMAKGQIEEGETALEAAVREAHEELGLREDNITTIIDCGNWLGRTQVFAAVVKTMDVSAFDDFHEETSETMWLTLAEFKRQGRDIHQEVVDALSFMLDSWR